jgi:hypothetical protein
MKKHPLGIPRITLKDHEQYCDLRNWSESQNWKTPEQVKREIMLEVLTRKPFNSGLYGKHYDHRGKK